jgi:predicted hotdog family 3-hydroxylacyl-ACP dehydratase
LEEVKDSIIEYIPQRPPMVMIDELIQANELSGSTSFTISPENIFVENDHFSEPGMIENIAQTAAAMVGYQSKVNNTPVPIGFIAAIKNWKLNRIPQVNTSIETTIEVVNSVMDVSIVEGTIKQGDMVLCNCEMRILIQKNNA